MNYTPNEPPRAMSAAEIEEILPHRYPFALVDKILDYTPGQWARGVKCVTRTEPFFEGHFPGHPVMPGVLILEALAQTGAVAALSLPENRGKLALFGGVKNARFRRQVIPGDVLILECELIEQHGPVGIGKATAWVDGVRAVNSPQAMSDLFVSLQKAVTYVCYGLVIVLAIVSVVVISNTIKITVFNRRKEIGIMKLVGATNGFIRFPFFVEGVTSGLISALIASAIVCGGYYAVYEWYGKNPTNLTTMFGGTLLPLQDLWYYVVLGFMLFGFVLCGIGTATSIRKHLQV